MLTPKWYQFLISCFASIGSFTFGYDLGIIAQVVASNTFIAKFDPTATSSGIVVSFFTGGAFCGAGIAGVLSDLVGRRATIFIATLIFITGGALQCGAPNLGTLQAGRWISGIGVGTLCMIIPLYQAEIAHPSIRGRVTALQQFFLGIGALCASWIGYGCYIGFSDNRQWRVPLGIQIIPGIILGSLIFLFPESPRWLISKGKIDSGMKTIAKLHAHGNMEDPLVRVEFEQICEDHAQESEVAGHSILELFKSKRNFRRILITTGLQASIQMTGVSAIQYFSPTIFAQIGLSTGRTLLFQAINSIIALIAQFLCILLVDYTGRRWPLILGNLGNSLTFIAGTILLAKFPPGVATNPRSAQIGFIATTWIYNFIFSACCGPLSWIIPAEVFNLETRSKGVSISTMMSFAFNTMIGQVTPIAMDTIGYRYYYLFIVCNVTNAIFFWLILPETAKTPLESMDVLWNEAPWFIPGWKRPDYLAQLEQRIEEVNEKDAANHVEQVIEEN